MSSGVLNIGILGCARIARRGLIAGIEKAPTARLAAIASRRRETAAAWAQEFGVPKRYASYDELIDDPDIDAVYIPLPNELHGPWTLRAAAGGKHVLCEKPLGLDLEDAQHIVEGCRTAGVVLMEAFMWRHHPRVAQMRQMLGDGKLGELRLVKMDFSFQITPGDWRLDPARGGGALYDLGCYGINAARLFAAAEPEEIFARGHFGPTGVDLTMAVEMRFAGGALALLDASFECPDRCRLEVVGTRGAIEVPGGVLPPAVSELVVRTESDTERIAFDVADQYAEEVEVFCASVAAGSLVAPAEDGLANMEALHAALRIARDARGD